MNHRRQILGDELIEAGLASLAIAPDNVLFTRWILDFAAF
jgi:hypothetical protein